MADKSNDPVAMWQNMIGEMEKGFNSFANQAMASPEFSKVMNQVGGASANAQKQLGEIMEKYLISMNLPSRAQMVGMAERLQSIEAQLNEIKAPPAGASPTRRRRPAALARRNRHAPGARLRPRERRSERAAGLDLADIPDRIQSECSARSSAASRGRRVYCHVRPVAGSTPKDILAVRGTMNLYHYRPVADEIYRVPILIVMATTNRGYILDMVRARALSSFS